jgi:leucine efflux protein
MMYGITDPLTFLVGTILIVLLPGPNSLFVLTVASSRGVGPGYRAALGVFTGDSILMLATSMGSASVLLANPVLFIILKYAGAAYLAYIGFGLLLSAWRHLRHRLHITSVATQPPSELPARTSLAQPFRRALLISLINPKAILFFVSFFVQFVDANYAHPALTFLLLGTIVQICSMLYLTCLIFAGTHLAKLVHKHPRINALCSASVGSLFIGFGLKLANASLKS